MALVLKNNAASRLASSITAGATTLTVTTGEGGRFPSLGAGDWFPVTIIKDDGTLEVVRCTARSGDVLTITRAQEGTAALAFSAGDRVQLRLTVAVIQALQADTAAAAASAAEAYKKNNIVGTVSQSGGVPTGAIIERGSNANGEYTKYADGTMTCTLSISVTDQAIADSYGASLFQGTRNWTFPIPFASAPSVNCGAFKWGSSASWSGVGNTPSTTGVTLRGWDNVSRAAGTSTIISATAQGRWF